MKSYGQYCAIARGLDVVGDRWTLLIVRDLLDGPRRYGELRDGLPGIATNLLGQRLRSLVEAGVVDHVDGRYALTAWGEGLRDVLYALATWAMPRMAEPPGDDRFRPTWLTHLIAIHLGEPDRRRPDGIIALDIDGADARVVLEVDGGTVEARVGATEGPPDAVVAGPPDGVGALVIGLLDLDDAQERSVTVDGDADLVTGLTRGVSSGV